MSPLLWVVFLFVAWAAGFLLGGAVADAGWCRWVDSLTEPDDGYWSWVGAQCRCPDGVWSPECPIDDHWPVRS